MMIHRRAATLALALGLAMVVSGRAEGAFLIGTQVTGSLGFGGGTTNYFDPNNGFVPTGYLNKTSGTTVTIAEPAIEFGFSDGSNTDTANFTDTQLVVTDVSTSGGASVLMTFTDAAFANTTVSIASSNFTGLTATRSGNTITVAYGSFSTIGTFTGTINITSPSSVPEPASVVMLALGLAGLGFAASRRRSRI